VPPFVGDSSRNGGGGGTGDGIALIQCEIRIAKTDLFKVSTNKNNVASGRWLVASNIRWGMLQQTNATTNSFYQYNQDATTQSNTIGQHITHVRMTCWAFLL